MGAKTARGTELTLYMESLKQYPLLTREQERELFAKYIVTRDPDLRDLIIHSNLRLVMTFAKMYAWRPEFPDLVQEGNMGLTKSVETFRPDIFGTKFSTHAVWMIRAFITRAAEKFGTVRISRKANDDANVYQEAREHGDSEGQFMAENGWSQERVDRAKKAIAFRDRDVPKDIMKEIPEQEEEPQFYEEELDSVGCTYDDLPNLVDELVSWLPPREQEIIRSRFGLGEQETTLTGVGHRLEITKERVRQLQAKALGKIREKLFERVRA